MENPMGRFIDATADQEMHRHRGAGRDMVREKKIAYRVVRNDEKFTGGSLPGSPIGLLAISSL